MAPGDLSVICNNASILFVCIQNPADPKAEYNAAPSPLIPLPVTPSYGPQIPLGILPNRNCVSSIAVVVTVHHGTIPKFVKNCRTLYANLSASWSPFSVKICRLLSFGDPTNAKYRSSSFVNNLSAACISAMVRECTSALMSFFWIDEILSSDINNNMVNRVSATTPRTTNWCARLANAGPALRKR